MAADEVARRYTIDELLALQHSPLVRKPDGLPDISEWMPAYLTYPTVANSLSETF